VYSGWHLCPLGRAKDAVLETGRIVAEDPLNLLGRWTYGASLFFARDFDRAAEEWSRLLDIDPSFPKALQALSVARGGLPSVGPAPPRDIQKVEFAATRECVINHRHFRMCVGGC
jgi:hypothetical protein